MGPEPECSKGGAFEFGSEDFVSFGRGHLTFRGMQQSQNGFLDVARCGASCRHFSLARIGFG